MTSGKEGPSPETYKTKTRVSDTDDKAETDTGTEECWWALGVVICGRAPWIVVGGESPLIKTERSDDTDTYTYDVSGIPTKGRGPLMEGGSNVLQVLRRQATGL